jgi:hypothetical protein
MISKDIFSRLLITTEIKTLTGLSKELGYTENWGTTTRKRGGIPYEACSKVSELHNISMDYLLYGIDNERKEINTDEVRIAVTEGIFSAIQSNLITISKDVKISHVSDVITSEIIEVCNVNDESQQLKKVQ